MRLSLLTILTACQLEDFTVSADFDKDPEVIPGVAFVTVPAAINENGMWSEKACALADMTLSTTWVVALTDPANTFDGYHRYEVDDLWREPSGTAVDGSNGILYSYSGAVECIAWEWVPAPADTGDTGP